jgi:hypothetical protein
MSASALHFGQAPTQLVFTNFSSCQGVISQTICVGPRLLVLDRRATSRRLVRALNPCWHPSAGARLPG